MSFSCKGSASFYGNSLKGTQDKVSTLNYLQVLMQALPWFPASKVGGGKGVPAAGLRKHLRGLLSDGRFYFGVKETLCQPK